MARILIVDADPIFMHMVAKQIQQDLKADSLLVDKTFDRQKALALAKEFDSDVLLIDSQYRLFSDR